MNRDTVIDFALAQLSKGEPLNLSPQMQARVDQDPALAEELRCIQGFWQTPEKTLPRPSANLRQGFYAMLEEANAQQAMPASQPVAKPFWQSVGEWLQMGPVAQFATLAIVFVVGVQVGQPPADTNEYAIAALEQQVSSLSSVVALSMLQQPSASERLHGVAYSARVPELEPVLLERFITVLEQDESTAVRLAVIDRLQRVSNLDALAARLIDITVTSDSPLVQIELIRLLHGYSEPDIKASLFKRLQSAELEPGVRDFMQQLRSTAQV